MTDPKTTKNVNQEHRTADRHIDRKSVVRDYGVVKTIYLLCVMWLEHLERDFDLDSPRAINEERTYALALIL